MQGHLSEPYQSYWSMHASLILYGTPSMSALVQKKVFWGQQFQKNILVSKLLKTHVGSIWSKQKMWEKISTL